VALKVLDENPGPPPECTDAGWYQGNVKLIACEDERSAALYKAAINKVGEVYPGAKLAVCEAADIPSRPRASPWLERRHRQVDFYLTQILSGHGSFRSYLKKYGHDTSDGCPSCGSGIEEDASRVLFECVRFVEDRAALEIATGVSTSPSTLVPTMLRDQMEWDATAKFCLRL